MTLSELASTLDAATADLTAADRALAALAAPPTAFGADAAGLPGRVGRDLQARWDAALAARSREAADAATRLSETAAAARTAARQYAETDAAAGRRLERELP
jgi:hypothetical protein